MKLTDEEVQNKIKDLPLWKYSDGFLSRELEFNSFSEALEFVNNVGKLAEKMNHHPNILMHDYKKVDITTSTHDEGGVTAKDFELARGIEELT
ncbi:MAG: 4a-hydroxytetrahydrobiopterin dehydratase [Candidatus Curtissbacteria bacterium]|nr:4a-hydroxytetrahydrobiopterin dehydratase [Candidatus Curtissbacteria bacterium]